MSEKRFVGQMCMDKLLVHFEDRDSEQNIPPIATIKDMEIVDKLNEQQATISQLQDLCGESDGENAKLRIENKKLKEKNEQLRKENAQLTERLRECRMRLDRFNCKGYNDK